MQISLLHFNEGRHTALMSLHYMFELALTVRIIIMMISMIVPMSNMIPDHLLFCGLGIMECPVFYLILAPECLSPENRKPS